MVIIEKQDEGLVITNQETGKRAVLRVSENARWVLQYSDGSVSRYGRTIRQAYDWVARGGN